MQVHKFSLADFPSLTPPKLFRVVRERFGAPVALLESLCRDAENTMSLIAFDPLQCIETTQNSFSTIRQALTRCQTIPHHFPFQGGLIGFMPFEIVDEIEPRCALPGKHLHALLYEFGKFFFFDHEAEILFAITLDTSFEDIATLLQKAIETEERPVDLSKFSGDEHLVPGAFTSSLTQQDFVRQVQEAKAHIVSGDIFQVIVSNLFSREIAPDQDGLDFYEVLRVLEPTTHLVFYDFGEHGQIGCASPEILGSKRGSHVKYAPIAGTRYRGQTPQEDTKILEEMRRSPKENAEHDMLVDLGRNDLGRVCRAGSVHMTREKYAKYFANVMHLVSDLEGDMSREFDAVDFFKSIFPAGTLTGAPKIRAIEIIRQLENRPRGLYGGSLGYFSTDGNMEFTIAIRSFFRHNARVFFQAGAGIVQDSDPLHEWIEVQNKAKSLMKTIQYVLTS